MSKKFLVKTIVQHVVWDLVVAESIAECVEKVETTDKDPFSVTNQTSWVKSVIEVDEWGPVVRDFHPKITENYIEPLVTEVVLK
jgi:hypothetical protein